MPCGGLGEHLVDPLVARRALGLELQHRARGIGLEGVEPCRQAGGGQRLPVPGKPARGEDHEPVDRRRLRHSPWGRRSSGTLCVVIGIETVSMIRITVSCRSRASC